MKTVLGPRSFLLCHSFWCTLSQLLMESSSDWEPIILSLFPVVLNSSITCSRSHSNLEAHNASAVTSKLGIREGNSIKLWISWAKTVYRTSAYLVAQSELSFTGCLTLSLNTTPCCSSGSFSSCNISSSSFRLDSIHSTRSLLMFLKLISCPLCTRSIPG